jgi:hypothetical protein
VEVIGSGCFSGEEVDADSGYLEGLNQVSHIRQIIFEPGSRLREMEPFAFTSCVDLESITIPASVEIMAGKSFGSCNTDNIKVARGNRHFHMRGKLLLDIQDTRIVLLVGHLGEITISDEIEVIGTSASVDAKPGWRVFRALSELEEGDVRAWVGVAGDPSRCICAVPELGRDLSKRIRERQRGFEKWDAVNRQSSFNLCTFCRFEDPRGKGAISTIIVQHVFGLQVSVQNIQFRVHFWVVRLRSRRTMN